MNILLTAATEAEIRPSLDFLKQMPQEKAQRVEVLISGVGSLHTAYSLGTRLNAFYPQALQLAIQAGIAGAWDKERPLGQVVQVRSDYNADLGAQTKEGDFLSISELGFLDISRPLFDVYSADGRLWQSDSEQSHFLPHVDAISVNTVHGERSSIERTRERLGWAQIETMESSAFFFACLQYQKIQPAFRFLALRSLSNYVEERNRANWQIPLAIKNLNEVLIEMLTLLL